MTSKLERLEKHVGDQYERRGLDRGRAQRIRDAVPEAPAPEPATEETPAEASAEEASGGD